MHQETSVKHGSQLQRHKRLQNKSHKLWMGLRVVGGGEVYSEASSSTALGAQLGVCGGQVEGLAS